MEESVNLHTPEDVRESFLEEKLFELSLKGSLGICYVTREERHAL